MATLTELIRQEDPKRPYTDEQLAQMLQLRREQVVELRRINGIPNSWMRLRPALVVEMQKLLEQEPGLSDRSLTLRLNAMGYNVSRYLVKELHSNLPEKEAEPQPEPAVEITTQEETEGTNVFAGMIGYDGGLKAQIHQAKAAVSYPPNGLHTLIIGPSGSGKTFLAENMYHYAVQQGLLAPDAPFVSFNCADYADNPQLLNSQLFGYVRGAFSGANATKDGLVQKADGGILFLDEIHRLSRQVEEVLYPALEDFALDIMIGKGPSAQSIRINLPKFTLVGATTRAGQLTGPLRDRFGILLKLELYSPQELGRIITRSAGILGVPITDEGALELARCARGTPRIANRLLKRARDFAMVESEGTIDEETAIAARKWMDIDELGLDELDRSLLRAIIEMYNGGPVGLETLAAALGEESVTLEDICEPYLMQMGMLTRTPRGRCVTRLAYEHLHMAVPRRFDEDDGQQSMF